MIISTVETQHPSLLWSGQTSVGQVSRVDVSSKVEVVWADNSMTIVLPQVRLCSSEKLHPTGCSEVLDPVSCSAPLQRGVRDGGD